MGIQKTGRKTKFSEELAAKMIEYFEQGKTDMQVAEIVGISVRTLNNWKGLYPEFFHSLKSAKQGPNLRVRAALYHRAIGYSHPEEKIYIYEGEVIRVNTTKHYPPDPTSAIFWLKNREPDEWRSDTSPPTDRDTSNVTGEKLTDARNFEEFCTRAGYPAPYEKQIEMMNFGMNGTSPRLLLGARGYGKTDYVVILGIAYKLKQDPNYRVLIVTKSKERNTAMLKEIAEACRLNGITFEKENSQCLRVTGLKGKDHSVSAVTIKSVSLRGRHPDLVIMDDPVTEDDTSEATRLLVEKKWNELNKLVQNILIIGQPAHKFDLYAKLRKLIPTLEVPHGTIIELDHDLEAQRIAGVSEESIQASYFLTIAAEGSIPFGNLKYIDQYPREGHSIAFLDPSHEGGDFTALTILKGHFDGVIVVGFVWKKAWYHCAEDVAQKLIAYNVGKFCIETNGLGEIPVLKFREILQKSPIGVVGKKSTLEKHSKIMAAGAHAHLIHLSKESDKTYTEQVEQYEYKAKHDDAPDSLASCLEWVGLIRGKT